MEGKFNSEDKEKVIMFLNFVAKKANFNMNTQEIIEYFKLINHMQQVILPKIDKNILEILDVKEESDKDIK